MYIHTHTHTRNHFHYIYTCSLHTFHSISEPPTQSLTATEPSLTCPPSFPTWLTHSVTQQDTSGGAPTVCTGTICSTTLPANDGGTAWDVNRGGCREGEREEGDAVEMALFQGLPDLPKNRHTLPPIQGIINIHEHYIRMRHR